MHNPNFPDRSRIRRWRGVAAVLLAILVLLVGMAPGYAATAQRAYAGIVVDAKSGKTLYESAADAPRYPASVTKVMTLYVLFEELKAGRLSLKSKLTISKHAAAAVPTKLGLRPGQTISVEDAIKAVVTLSANDIARAIAEAISGSESKFAQRMTKTARALGMNRTTYANASGLPDKRQVTTVRDQALLGIAVYEHFPDYYAYFQTKVFKYGGKRYGNHNQLLGAVPGVDGIKTGYISAGGYNLLTAARTDGRHIVVVGFGFDTGASRNAKVTALINKYLPKARSGSYLETAMIPLPGTGLAGPSAAASNDVRMATAQPAPIPDFRKIIVSDATAVAMAPAMPLPVPLPAPLAAESSLEAVTSVAAAAPAPRPPEAGPVDVIGAWISNTLRLDGNVGAPMPPASIGGPVPPLALGAASNGTIDLLTSGSIPEAAESADTVAPGWIVQIGAAPNEDGARALLADAAEIGRIADYRRYVERFERNGQVFFRARIAGFVGRDQARQTCEVLKKQNMSCLAMQG